MQNNVIAVQLHQFIVVPYKRLVRKKRDFVAPVSVFHRLIHSTQLYDLMNIHHISHKYALYRLDSLYRNRDHYGHNCYNHSLPSLGRPALYPSLYGC